MAMTDTGTARSRARGAPTVYPAVLYDDARAAILQLTEGLGFTEVTVHEDGGGVVMHAELAQGNGAVLIGTRGRGGPTDEAMRGAGPAGVYVVVDDVDGHHRRAAELGLEVLTPPTDRDYGSREYVVRDLEGNVWTFGTYCPDLSPE